MNKVLRGSLIKRPKSIPHPTLIPKKERMWHAEHFGNVSEIQGKIAAANRTGEAISEAANSEEAKEAREAVSKAANSEEAKVAGEVAKDTGKEIIKILFEIGKILISSSSGIAIYSGIVWIVSENINDTKKMTDLLKKSFFISLVVGIIGAIATFLMSYKKPTKAPEDTIEDDTS